MLEPDDIILIGRAVFVIESNKPSESFRFVIGNTQFLIEGFDPARLIDDIALEVLRATRADILQLIIIAV